MTDVMSEELLARVLKTVAEAAVPDSVVPDVGELAGAQDPFEEDPDWEDVDGEWPPSPRRRRLGRGLGAAVVVLALGGAGAGIAAATRAFSTEGTALVGPAIGTILPTGKWTAANVTTRLTEAGPNGSTLTLETASADAAGGCMRLIVSAPGTTPTGRTVSCSEAYNTLHPPTTHTPTNTAYGTATQSWTSPSGTRWLFVYGRSQTPSATKVGAESKAGAVLATAAISNGWFILSVPTTERTTGRTGRHLVYYGPTGNQSGAYPTL